MNLKFAFIPLILIFNSIQAFCQPELKLIPKPQELDCPEGYFFLSGNSSFTSSGADVNLNNYIKDYLKELYGFNFSNNKKGFLRLYLDKSFLNTEPEGYSLSIYPDSITIISSTNSGLFYGIQTFFQLLPKSTLNDKTIKIQCCKIRDYPAFSWRGLNLDCSRHFMSKDFIKRYIDILAYYKFNVFHWHLTDDQGWRIEIKKYPRLTGIGAWRKEADGSIYGGFYTQEQIKEIVAYAQSRYITVVPEIEMPGHSLASLAAYPENSCTGGPFEVTNMWGVMLDVYCAGRDSTFLFLENILDEVVQLFPGKYIHIGGDEVPKNRWKECPRCQARIRNEGLKDEHELQSYFIKRISNYLAGKGKTVIGWDEILQGGLASGAIVQSWQSFQGAIDAARLAHYVICSPGSHTYLNADPEDLDLRIAYSFNPIPDGLTSEEKKFILGGEANLWTERAPQELVDNRLFPRILALAEVFWRNPQKDFDEFYSRVQKSYDDLTARGISYGPESKEITYTTAFDDLKKEFTVSLTSLKNDLEIHYTNDGTEPDNRSPLYKSPIKINKSGTLKIAAFRNNLFTGKKIILSFDFHKALNSKIILKNKYDERYRANGDNGLVDGIRGTNNFREGSWQGFEGVDFEAVIDLGSEKEISAVIPRFLLDSNSWIFLPPEVRVSISKDSVNYSSDELIANNIPQKNSEILFKDFKADFQKQTARFIKIKAENIKVCPEWHPGAGGKAWLFIDEIVVE